MKGSLMGLQCMTCGYFDYRVHRTINDCIAFLDSEIQRLESGGTVFVPFVAEGMIRHLKWGRGILVDVKDGKNREEEKKSRCLRKA